MNPIGLAAGLAAFLGIWTGHVAVRKTEASASSLWPPIAAFIILGSLLEWMAASAGRDLVSAAAGILGITLFWDALELLRQERRVRVGHAPANPANPRHRRMLESAGSRATTRDLLKREPLGR
jgi:hypothetical protein